MNRPVFKVPISVYKFKKGSYGLISHNKNYIFWVDCREDFANYLTSSHLYGLYHARKFLFITNHPERVRDFIAEFEERLKITKKTKILPTDKDNIVLVKPSEFWETPVNHSLLTILLRAGNLYKKIKGECTEKSFKKALKHDYLVKTKKAVNRFIKGHTKYNGKEFAGWVDHFKRGNEKDLVKP